MVIKNHVHVHNHSMSSTSHHQQCLQQLCRVCGGIFKHNYKKYGCMEHTKVLEDTLGITGIAESSVEVFPTHFCKCCYATMQQITSAQRKSHVYNHSLTLFDWQPHMDSNCMVRVKRINTLCTCT